MDEIVKQAMAKWPNVPHCYGWLALDARGAWRMRDERAQTLGLPGDKIVHAALLGFINRNYTHDDHGRWYFQNGPQRVYVDLEAAPYIARTDPAQGFLLHTGEPLPTIDAAWLTETGRLVLQSSEKIAVVDDRDIAQCIADLRIDGIAVKDEQLLEWLADQSGKPDPLILCIAGRQLPVQRMLKDMIPDRFGFVQRPQPDNALPVRSENIQDAPVSRG
ncbi:MAG: hypothetical protein JWQ21_2696 [Herminiimonas sp.]|nr:hypothetical protein [Herminiimonas sp.]